MDRPVLVAAALVAVGATACHQVTNSFTCGTDSDCALASSSTARCEPDHHCSYADADCPSGSRYGDYAGDASNQCTGDALGDRCATSVRAGVHDTCALRGNGSIACWGNGVADVVVPSLPAGTYVQLDVSSAGLCARTGDGSLACSEGPTTGAIDYPSRDLSIGGSHLCAVSQTGFAACWGTSPRGQLGDGSTDPASTPSGVFGLFDVKQIAAGFDSTCAVNNSGPLWCWGDNTRDQLGQGVASVDFASSPISVNAGAASELVAVGDQFACVVIDGGDVLCWGDNTTGQIGQGSTSATVNAATKVTALSNIVQITAAGSHACARDGDGQVWCWGSNGSHEASASAEATIPTPELVIDGSGTPIAFDDVDAGALHTCGVDRAGDVYCWGGNADAQIGDGTMSTAATPTKSTALCGGMP